MYNYEIVIYDEHMNKKDTQNIVAKNRIQAFREYEKMFGRIGIDDSYDAILISFY